MPFGELAEEFGELRMLLGEHPGAIAYLIGEQQLSARRRPEPFDGVERTLVGYGEGADLLDRVAPELDPDRVLFGRREHVDDATAYGEFATALDQVDPVVRGAREPSRHVLHLDLAADGEFARLEVGQALNLRLQHRPDRGDQDPNRPGASLGIPGLSRRRFRMH